MKKRRAIKATAVTVIISILIMMTASGCSIGGNTGKTAPTEAVKQGGPSRYTINAELNPTDKTLTAEQQVEYVNNENVGLKELYFHVYPNAFKSEKTAPFLFDDFQNAYKRGFEPGYIDVQEVNVVSGQTRSVAKHGYQGEGSTILKIDLGKEIKPGEHITLAFKYKIHIPPAGERFGYGEHNFNLGNWYPVAAVYDKTGWNLDKYYSIGDPFYSDVSDYTVSIKAPKAYTIAASGRLVEDKTEGESRVWKFQSDNMRDFAFIANDNFGIYEGSVDGIKVKSYYYKGDEERGKEALNLAIKAIKLFNSKFGKYPYPNYSVVQTIFPSGMEYPGIVYINDESYDKDYNDEVFLLTVVHETAHQWWYGVVGDDQIDEAWLDEGFATYSESIYVENEFGKQSQRYYMENVTENEQEAISSKVFDGVVLRSLKQFKNWDDYGPAVYNGGAITLDQLRKAVGDEVFFKILQTYYSQYKFKIATTQDFIDVSEKVSGKDLDPLFDKYLMAK